MTDTVTRSDVETTVEDAMAEFEEITHTVNEIYLSGPGSDLAGEKGGVTIVLDGAPDSSLEDVEDAAGAVEAALEELGVSFDRKRTAESWDVGDGPAAPRIEIATAELA